MNKSEHENLRTLIIETVTLLCKNGLKFNRSFSVEGLLGITLDESDVFLVNIKETVRSALENIAAANAAAASAANDDEHAAAADDSTRSSARKRRRRRHHNNRRSQSISRSDESDDADDDDYDAHARRGTKRSRLQQQQQTLDPSDIKREGSPADDVIIVKEENDQDQSYAAATSAGYAEGYGYQRQPPGLYSATPSHAPGAAHSASGSALPAGFNQSQLSEQFDNSADFIGDQAVEWDGAAEGYDDGGAGGMGGPGGQQSQSQTILLRRERNRICNIKYRKNLTEEKRCRNRVQAAIRQRKYRERNKINREERTEIRLICDQIKKQREIWRTSNRELRQKHNLNL